MIVVNKISQDFKKITTMFRSVVFLVAITFYSYIACIKEQFHHLYLRTLTCNRSIKLPIVKVYLTFYT